MDGHVSRPQLAQLVTIPVSRCSLDDYWREPNDEKECLNPIELAINVSSYDKIACLILPHNFLCQLYHLISHLQHELLVGRFEGHVEDLDFLTALDYFRQVQVSA